jgi:D-alanine transaminase
VADGLVYVQVGRGVARRDHAFPVGAKPSLVVTARNIPYARYEAWAAKGVAVKSVPETRWARCDIKSTALVANVLAKQAAREAGAFEAWFVDGDGRVTEGASTTAWIVDETGVLRTRHLDTHILPGVTRGELLPMCRQLGIKAEERAFTLQEAMSAREAFLTAATIGVVAITRIDGQQIGDGKPGPIARELRKAYWRDRT